MVRQLTKHGAWNLQEALVQVKGGVSLFFLTRKLPWRGPLDPKSDAARDWHGIGDEDHTCRMRDHGGFGGSQCYTRESTRIQTRRSSCSEPGSRLRDWWAAKGTMGAREERIWSCPAQSLPSVSTHLQVASACQAHWPDITRSLVQKLNITENKTLQ